VFERHRSDLHLSGSVIIVTLGAILQVWARDGIERKAGLEKGIRSARRLAPARSNRGGNVDLKAFPRRRVTLPPLGGVNVARVRKGTFVGAPNLNAGPEKVTPNAAPGS
jgi:hypothetical protein